MFQRLLNLPKTQSFFLTGPRGVGKSTLLKQRFAKESVLWIDLLEQRREFALSRDPDSLLDEWKAQRPHPTWIVIDEVQKIPRLLDVAHRGIENYGIKFALTGSSARKLKRGGANLLAGRAVEMQMFPLSALELGEEFNLGRALRFGTLPRLWSAPTLSDDEKTRMLFAYVGTYLKEEIAAEQLVRQLDPFRRFLLAAAQSNARIVSFSNVGRDAAVDAKQVERHFEILIDTLIGQWLEPYDRSIRRRQSQKSKFYFFDTGVVRALRDMADEPLHSSTAEYGEMFETFVINEFFRLRAALQKRWRFSYLRTKDDVEVDLIIEKPRGLPILVELKSGTQPVSAAKLASLRRICDDIPHSAAYVLSTREEASESEGVRHLHWQQGLREIFDLD